MADEIDMGCEHEAKYRAAALEAQHEKAEKDKLLECGTCYNCGAKIAHGLFCDRDCRDDYDHRLKIKQRTRG